MLQERDGFQGENLFFHRNLPLKWVRIVGVVVAVDDFAGLRAYTIDDSSGACTEAIVSLAMPKAVAPANELPGAPAPAPSTPYEHVDVGSVVDVKGALTTFRDAKQLKVEKMIELRSTADEVRLWAKRSAFRRDVLEKPWVVPDKMIRKCRRDAERTEAEDEKKRKRLQAAVRKSGKADGAQRRRPVVDERDERDESDGQGKRTGRRGEEDLKALASFNGGYSALGL